VAVGQGAVNWNGIFRQLEADQYGGWLTLDPFVIEEAFAEWCILSAEFLASYITVSQASSASEHAKTKA
jgi:sugar phosphate isomerase/epimerase